MIRTLQTSTCNGMASAAEQPLKKEPLYKTVEIYRWVSPILSLSFSFIQISLMHCPFRALTRLLKSLVWKRTSSTWTLVVPWCWMRWSKSRTNRTLPWPSAGLAVKASVAPAPWTLKAATLWLVSPRSIVMSPSLSRSILYLTVSHHSRKPTALLTPFLFFDR